MASTAFAKSGASIAQMGSVRAFQAKCQQPTKLWDVVKYILLGISSGDFFGFNLI